MLINQKRGIAFSYLYLIKTRVFHYQKETQGGGVSIYFNFKLIPPTITQRKKKNLISTLQH